MDDPRAQREARSRRRTLRYALLAAFVGALMTLTGFVGGAQRSGDAATGWGALAGAGGMVMLGGVLVALLFRMGLPGQRPDGEQTKRDRLQSQRVGQLWLFPLSTVAFLVGSMLATQDILAGEGSFGDYIWAVLPVIYAWLIASIALGWDYQSQTQRKFLEDELTAVLRARAVVAGFVVLMVGGSIAFALGLWRQDLGIAALLLALTGGGVTVGTRFAWLYREFDKDA